MRRLAQLAAAAALLATTLTTGVAQADGGWLDATPQQWNNPGASVPAAPQGDNLDRCAQQERQPTGAEESQVAAAGWRLESYWPMQQSGKVSVVVATASYDGMCRPWAFNAFVFSDQKFAGTLAPAPMNSREDGVLRGTPVVQPDGWITAEFTRYAPDDPLCCPSRGVSTVTYRIIGDPGMPYAVVDGAVLTPVLPTQLPRTGDETNVPAVFLALAGIFAALAGFVLRRARTLAVKS